MGAEHYPDLSPGPAGTQGRPLRAGQDLLARRSLLRATEALIASGAAFLAAAFAASSGHPAGRVAWLLAGAASLELGGFLALRSKGPIRGFQVKPPVWSYAAGLGIAGVYSALTLAGDAAARGELGILAPLKLLAFAAAMIAGVFEETLFRGQLMDRLARAGHGRPVQVLLSGLAFGGLHFYAFAGLRIAVMAQAATVVLGWALAGLYLVARRSLWPCVAAHALIDVILEPALLLSFVH